MTILGIDPGIARAGWGIIRIDNGQFSGVDFGCFESSSTEFEAFRLKKLHLFFRSLINKHKPDVVSLEELFFAANAKTALTVGQARGVIVLTACLLNIQIYSYTPLQVKQALTGYGRADKNQIQTMVKTILKLTQLPKPDDAADALAIAITHAFSYKMAR